MKSFISIILVLIITCVTQAQNKFSMGSGAFGDPAQMTQIYRHMRERWQKEQPELKPINHFNYTKHEINFSIPNNKVQIPKKELTYEEAIQKERFPVIIFVIEDEEGNLTITNMAPKGMALRAKSIEAIIRAATNKNPTVEKILPSK